MWMDTFTPLLLICLFIAGGYILWLRAEIARLNNDNAFLMRWIETEDRAIEFWRRVATGGAFAEFINALNFDRQEHKP